MHKHLYDLTKPCPAIVKPLELTNDIKEYILANRIYNVPSIKKVVAKTQSDSVPKTNEDNQCFGYIYLIREREFYVKNEAVYKVGRTIQKNPSCFLERLRDYKKGSQLYAISPISTEQCVECETTIINKFRETFPKHDDGHEYFIGEPSLMWDIIVDVIRGMRIQKQIVVERHEPSLVCQRDEACSSCSAIDK